MTTRLAPSREGCSPSSALASCRSCGIATAAPAFEQASKRQSLATPLIRIQPERIVWLRDRRPATGRTVGLA